jgi:hypothetical protein
MIRSKRRIPQFRHSRFPGPELSGLELTLLDLLRQLDSANGDCRVVESFESQHRPNPLFDSAVVLFDEIVQIFGRYSTTSLMWHSSIVPSSRPGRLAPREDRRR